MNLSDLITTAPEPPKGKGGAKQGTPDQSQNSESFEGAEFLAMTLEPTAPPAEETTAAPVGLEQLTTATATLVGDVLGRSLSAESEDIGALPLGGETAGPDVSQLQGPVKPDIELNVPTVVSDLSADEGAPTRPALATDASARILTVEGPPPEAPPIAEPVAMASVVSPSDQATEEAPLQQPMPVTAPAQAPGQNNGPSATPLETLVGPQQRSRNAPADPTPGDDGLLTERPAAAIRAEPPAKGAPEQPGLFQTGAASAQADWRLLQGLYNQASWQPSGFETAIASQSQGGSTPIAAANGLSAGAFASEMTPQAVQRAVLPQIVGSIQNLSGGGVIDLMLEPPELGRIEIVIELSDKSLRATLSADRSFTGDLIRRQADELLQQFADAGFDDVDLQFADRDREGTDTDEGDATGSRGLEDAVQPDNTSRRSTVAPASGRIDMRL